jgi:hypothetical protein
MPVIVGVWCTYSEYVVRIRWTTDVVTAWKAYSGDNYRLNNGQKESEMSTQIWPTISSGEW